MRARLILETKRLIAVDGKALYSPPGYLLFIRDGTLMGQSFDVKRIELSGEPFSIAENVRFTRAQGRSPLSVSDNGILAYRLGTAVVGSRLAWLDRSGTRSDTIYQTGLTLTAGLPRLSSDDKRILTERSGPTSGTDIWIIDVVRGTNSRFTSGTANEESPVWSPDGSQVVFRSNKDAHFDLYLKTASGVGEEQLLFKSDQDKRPLSWSPDGRFLLFQMQGDLWILPMSVPASGNRSAEVFLKTKFTEGQAQFSPDGKWVAYTSDESGANQVHVRAFPASGEQWQVSLNGGQLPQWRPDGKELFFLDSRRNLMAVEIKPGSSFDFAPPKILFEVTGTTAEAPGYAVTRDGKSFLFPGTPPDDVTVPITVVLNWKAGLKK